MWKFLRSKGFAFYNGTGGGKAMTEDAELSMAITFTGHSLYFDERLWFTHDLRGGRITWKNFLSQQLLGGKCRLALCMYQLAHCKILYNVPFALLFIKQLIFLVGGFILHLVKVNLPEFYHYFGTIKEMILNIGRYKRLSESASIWIAGIKDTFPLSSGRETNHG